MPKLTGIAHLQRAIVLLGLASGTLLIGGLVAIKVDDYLTFGIARFSAVAWHKVPTREEELSCYRGAMAYDVKDNILKRGSTRAEVEATLGPQDTPGGYNLGLCSAWDEYSLQVRYNSADMLSDSHLMQH